MTEPRTDRRTERPMDEGEPAGPTTDQGHKR